CRRITIRAEIHCSSNPRVDRIVLQRHRRFSTSATAASAAIQQPVGIAAIYRIVAAVAEYVAVAPGETRGVFAQETAEARMIGTVAVFVDTESFLIFAPGKLEAVVKISQDWIQCCRRTEGIVTILLDHFAGKAGKMGHATDAVLLEE